MDGPAHDPGKGSAFRSVLEVLPIAAWIHAGGVILYTNPEMVRLLGAARAGEIVGRRVDEFVPASGRPLFTSRVARLLAGEPMPPRQERLLPISAGPVTVEACSTLIEFESQAAILAMFSGANRETVVARQWRRQARRYTSILECVPANIFAARPDGHIEFINRWFLDRVGLRLRDVLGYRWADVLHAEDRDRCLRDWTRALDTGEPFESEYRCRVRDGSYRWFHARAEPVRDDEGRILRWFGVALDVEEQKRNEAALTVSDRRFRRIFDGNLIGVVIGTQERAVEANDLFLRMIDRTRKELESGALTWAAIVPPEQRELGRRKFQEVADVGQCAAFESAMLCPDGTRVPVLIAGMSLAHEPEPRNMALVVDITERRQLQEIRAEKMKLETVSLLAAGMAHNLNNLLTTIIGNASLLLDQHITLADSRAYSLVRDVIAAGDRAAKLVSKLLASAGHGRLTVSPVAIGPLIEDEIGRLRKTLPENVEVQVSVAPGVPSILVDREQLRQVIEGVVTNAVEAIGARENGQVAVSARVERLSIADAADVFAAERLAPGDYCVVEVRDNGCGMDHPTMSRIFDPFFSTKFTGRGLSLAAIAGIVRAARGAIRVRSTPGTGTVFRIYLPAA